MNKTYVRKSKNFKALEWLAPMCLHIPNYGEQMIILGRHYMKNL